MQDSWRDFAYNQMGMKRTNVNGLLRNQTIRSLEIKAFTICYYYLVSELSKISVTKEIKKAKIKRM